MNLSTSDIAFYIGIINTIAIFAHIFFDERHKSQTISIMADISQTLKELKELNTATTFESMLAGPVRTQRQLAHKAATKEFVG